MGNTEQNDLSGISNSYQEAIEKKSACTHSDKEKGDLCKSIEEGSIIEMIKQTVNTYLDADSYEKISKLLGSKDIKGLLDVLEDNQIGTVINEVQKLINTYPDYAKYVVDQILNRVRSNLEEKYKKAIKSGDEKSKVKLRALHLNFPVVQKFFSDSKKGEKRVKEFLNIMSDREILLSFLRVGKDLKDYNSKKYKGFWGRRGKIDATKVAGEVVNLDFKKLKPIFSEFIDFYLNNPDILKQSLKSFKMGHGKRGEKRKERLAEHLQDILPLFPNILANKENLRQHQRDIGKIIYYMKRLGDPRTSKFRKLWSITKLTMYLEGIDPELSTKILKREFIRGKRSKLRNSWKKIER